jgi:hypothetical protein
MVRPEASEQERLGTRSGNLPLADRGTATAAAPNSDLLLQCQKEPMCSASREAGALATAAGSKLDPFLQRCTEL